VAGYTIGDVQKGWATSEQGKKRRVAKIKDRREGIKKGKKSKKR
jgi:hypothetical protein